MTGQSILEELRLGNGAVRSLRLAANDRVDGRLLLRMEHLADELTSCRGVMPRRAFVVGEQSRLSLLAITITYFVVLLQFDLNEYSSDKY